MTHALTPYQGSGYFNAAFIADDTFVTWVLVLSTIALVIAGRPKDSLAEQSILFRAESAVIDRLRF
jgi:hypothetical protein